MVCRKLGRTERRALLQGLQHGCPTPVTKCCDDSASVVSLYRFATHCLGNGQKCAHCTDAVMRIFGAVCWSCVNPTRKEARAVATGMVVGWDERMSLEVINPRKPCRFNRELKRASRGFALVVWSEVPSRSVRQMGVEKRCSPWFFDSLDEMSIQVSRSTLR